MSRQRTGIDVEPATGGRAHEDLNSLAGVEVGGLGWHDRSHTDESYGYDPCQKLSPSTLTVHPDSPSVGMSKQKPCQDGARGYRKLAPAPRSGRASRLEFGISPLCHSAASC